MLVRHTHLILIFIDSYIVLLFIPRIVIQGAIPVEHEIT